MNTRQRLGHEYVDPSQQMRLRNALIEMERVEELSLSAVWRPIIHLSPGNHQEPDVSDPNAASVAAGPLTESRAVVRGTGFLSKAAAPNRLLLGDGGAENRPFDAAEASLARIRPRRSHL